MLALDAMLTTVIIWKVPFTNVDWESYMAQVDLVLQGEYDAQLNESRKAMTSIKKK